MTAPLGRVLLAGAAGGFGRLFADMLDSFVAVDVVPCEARPAGSAAAWLVGDVARPHDSFATVLAQTDTLLLCVPEPAALAALRNATPLLAPGALVVDTLSVKSPVAALADGLREDLELVSINPLFAPGLGFADQGVAAVVLRDGPRARGLLSLLAGAGASVISLGAREHDERAADAQVAVHALVLAYGAYLAARGEVDLRFTTPPQRALLALVSRVVGFDPEVYRHIQLDNPYAAQARALLARSLDEVESAALEPSGEQFSALFARIAAVLDEVRGSPAGGAAPAQS